MYRSVSDRIFPGRGFFAFSFGAFRSDGSRTDFYVVGLGLLMKQDVFGDFLNGAKDGMQTVIGIVPTLIGLMAAVGVLRSSGFLEDFGKLLGTVLEPAGIPSAGAAWHCASLF